MRIRLWLRTTGALGTAGALALSTALVTAQESLQEPLPPKSAPAEGAVEVQGRIQVVEAPPGEPRGNVFFIAAEEPEAAGEVVITATANTSEYWIGVECHPLEEALRAQLGLKDDGLIIEQIMPDGPAAKSDLKRFDVLVSVNDKPLRQVADLIGVLQDTKDKELKFKVVRGGKETNLQVTPAKRPAGQGGGEGLRDILIQHLGQHNAELTRQPLRMQFLHPGMVLPPGAPTRAELPDDMSVFVRKDGKKPAEIEVKRGDKSWTTSEDKLAELPEDVRGPVEGWLGRGPGPAFNIKLPDPNDVRMRVRRLETPRPLQEPPVRRADPASPQPAPPEVREGGGPARVVPQPLEPQPSRAARGPVDLNARIEQRLQAMADRMEQMNRDLQELRQQRRTETRPARDRDRDRDRRDRDDRERGDRDLRDRNDDHERDNRS